MKIASVKLNSGGKIPRIQITRAGMHHWITQTQKDEKNTNDHDYPVQAGHD